MIWGGVVTFLVFGGLTVAAVAQVLPCLRRIKRIPDDQAASNVWPRAQIILSLKGVDPFLEDCLTRLAAQDYPDFQVTVVVDSASDPAWPLAVAAQQAFGRDLVDLRVRTHSVATCTRKLNNQLTAFDCLPAGVEIVALCDGDAVVHPSWLRELVQGLNNPAIAAVSGNRWYSPTDVSVTSLSRHYWNALAIPTQHQHRIIWGGSLALRRSVVDEPAFREAFSKAFSDDAGIAEYLFDTGRTCEVLDATYVVNSESIELPGYWNFLVRQMICVRMDHPRWRPVLWHAITLALAMMALLPALFLSGAAGAAIGLAGLALYGVTLLMLTTACDLRLRREFPDRAPLHVPIGLKRIALAIPALLLTAFIYPAATITAACSRRVVWRGIEYELAGGQVLSMTDSEPSPLPLTT